ncbi:hypothetical protein HPP92_015552 [Vanilla planifolia]|uniref:Uncharacterized protein n=1 Tax=Vanilla planifolia TaxID=51239 RepID=A0A835UN83_VANPL|nr:hypothetical protein HPP92_016179 [Vanilla planifolia]KAG0471006.1 hypothetical protein HPP92_015552 [Vanilla planifolia]
MADVNFSAASDETTTGYLQDAVAEWSERCKRRRTVSSWGFESPTTTATDDVKELVQVNSGVVNYVVWLMNEEEQRSNCLPFVELMRYDMLQDFWDWNCADDGDGDLDSLLQGSSIGSEENENALGFFESMMQSGTGDEGKERGHASRS